jgi:hypothetical protein
MVEHVLSVADGAEHAIWGRHFARRFGFEPPVANDKIRSFYPKKDPNGEDDDDDDNSSRSSIKKVAWYHPAKYCK